MLSNPAVGNGSQKFKRKLTNKHVKGRRAGNTLSRTENTQTWEPKTPTQELGKENTNPGTENTKTWEPETPREPKKTNLGKGNTTGRENTNLGTENTQPLEPLDNPLRNKKRLPPTELARIFYSPAVTRSPTDRLRLRRAFQASDGANPGVALGGSRPQ